MPFNTALSGLNAASADFLATKLVRWDVRDARGAEVEIAAAALLRLAPEAFHKLFRVVLGYAPSDVDPQWSDARLQRWTEEVSAASKSGDQVYVKVITD